MPRLLYVADNGFRQKDDKFYYSKPNAINSEQYHKYFETIYYLARKTDSESANLEISPSDNAVLCNKYDFLSLRKEATNLLKKVDAVVFRNGINGCFLVGLAKKMGVVIISYNGADPFEFQKNKKGIKGKIIAPLWRILEKRRMREADYAHYCAKFLKDNYPCLGKSLVCSNVSINPDMNVLEKRLKHINNKQDKKYRIGLIGQLNDNRKGIEYAIQAISLLLKKGIDVYLEIAGSGNYEIWIRLAQKLNMKEHILLKGYIPSKEEMFLWLDEIDIYIQPSLCEGLPRATIEAMSRGCPIVATNVDAIPEIIGKEVLVPIKSGTAIAERIEWLIHDKKNMILQAEKNFNKSMDYRVEIRDKKLDDFYNRIVNECKKK